VKGQDPLRYGWVIVGVSFITVGLAYAVWYSFSVFFVAILKEFGWSRSLAAGAFSLFAVVHGATGPFVGGMVDRFGPRRVIVVGSLCLGFGLALCSFTGAWWHYYLFFGFITAAGVGTIGWVPNTTLIQQWFKTNRGLAIGIISSGIGVGILVCVPSAQHIISRLGWRTAYRIMALGIPLIVAAMALVFLRRSPETTSSRDAAVPQKEIIGTAAEAPPILDEEWTSRSWTVRQALTTRQFRLLCIAFPLGPLTVHSILTHQVAFFVDQGVDTLFASYIVGIVGVTSVGAKILWGILSDRIGREATYTMGITCGVCGIIVLIIFSVHPFSILKYFYGILFGMGYAAVAALPAIITADFFEGRGYGGIFGTLMFLMGIGTALGAWFAGFLHDQMGSYVLVFIIMIACALFTCLIIWMAAPRKIRTVPGKRRASHPSE
jgi:MFS family permease